MAKFQLETERLLLRDWRDGDFGALHALGMRQAGIDRRHFHIGGGAFGRQQVVLLEDEAERLAAQQCPAIGIQRRHLAAIEAVAVESHFRSRAQRQVRVVAHPQAGKAAVGDDDRITFKNVAAALGLA